MSQYPQVKDPALVGTYPATAKAGGGYVWDEVLEYRVWCHPERGAQDLADPDFLSPHAPANKLDIIRGLA